MTRILAVLFSAVFAFAAAHAADVKPLTEDEAKRFVATLPAVDELGSELREDGKIEALNARSRPKAGEEFKPYSGAVAGLKEKHPAEHGRLAAIVGKHGFSTDAWGAVGDRVMVAYLAERMERENPGAMKQMEAMDASMIDMMPAHVKEQMAAAMALMDSVKNAPAEDRKTVALVSDDLDAFMDEQEAKHAGK